MSCRKAAIFFGFASHLFFASAAKADGGIGALGTLVDQLLYWTLLITYIILIINLMRVILRGAKLKESPRGTALFILVLISLHFTKNIQINYVYPSLALVSVLVLFYIECTMWDKKKTIYFLTLPILIILFQVPGIINIQRVVLVNNQPLSNPRHPTNIQKLEDKERIVEFRNGDKYLIDTHNVQVGVDVELFKEKDSDLYFKHYSKWDRKSAILSSKERALIDLEIVEVKKERFEKIYLHGKFYKLKDND